MSRVVIYESIVIDSTVLKNLKQKNSEKSEKKKFDIMYIYIFGRQYILISIYIVKL